MKFFQSKTFRVEITLFNTALKKGMPGTPPPLDSKSLKKHNKPNKADVTYTHKQGRSHPSAFATCSTVSGIPYRG